MNEVNAPTLCETSPSVFGRLLGLYDLSGWHGLSHAGVNNVERHARTPADSYGSGAGPRKVDCNLLCRRNSVIDTNHD